MTNRREFLQAATALSAVPLVGTAAFTIGRGPMAIEAVVFDIRHPEAHEFSAHAVKLGALLREIEGDITDLWQNELFNRWKAKPAALAGLTERPALFLLERLAWDHGMRVVFEAEHTPDGRGGAAHRVLRTGNPTLVHELNLAGRHWTAVLAENLIAGAGASTRDFQPTDAALAAYQGEPVKLYSWIIAPRTAA